MGLIGYRIKTRPKIPRNKYGYLTETSTGGGSLTTTGSAASGGGSVSLPGWADYVSSNATNDGISVSAKVDYSYTLSSLTGQVSIGQQNVECLLNNADGYTTHITTINNSGFYISYCYLFNDYEKYYYQYSATPSQLTLTQYDDTASTVTVKNKTYITPISASFGGNINVAYAATLGSLTVAGNSTFVSSISTSAISNSGRITSSTMTLTSIPSFGTATGESGFFLALNSSGVVKSIPHTTMYYKNNAINIGTNTDEGKSGLNIYGDLYVSGAVEYQTLEADEATITKLTSTSVTYLGGKICTSYGTNGNIVFDYGVSEGKQEFTGLVEFYGSPTVWHYQNDSWVDYSVLDLSNVVEEIDDTDLTDNVPTDRAVAAFVKDYVNSNAAALIDVTVLASNSGTTSDYRGIDLLKQPLYLFDPAYSTYCSAKIISLTGSNPVYLEWELYESANLKRIYRIKLTNSTYGDFPWQTKEKIVAGNKQYRTEQYGTSSTTFVGWQTATI